MQLPLPAAPDYSQALRYLGVPEGDAASRALLERCAAPLWQAASPRGTARAVPTGQLPAELTAGRDIRLTPAYREEPVLDPKGGGMV